MGGALCSRIRPNNAGVERHRQSRSNSQLLMNKWKTNDVLYLSIKSRRDKLHKPISESTQRTVAKFSPCQLNNCKCQGGIFKGVKRDHFGRKNSICVRPGCNHPLSDHISHLKNVSKGELTMLRKLTFDIINTKKTLKNLSKKPKSKRNMLLKNIFESVYDVLNKSTLIRPLTAPNIDTIYGSPPFERTNIDQVLFNFCMHIFNDDNILGLKNALILSKFVLKYFDTWMWTIPKEQLKCNSQEYSKSYNYYYCRFLMYCSLPRCVHSIPLRYRASKIFGQEVLKYTLKAFKMQLQVWCYKHNIMWGEHTKLFCLNYLPIYMDLLEKEVFNDKSQIWFVNYDVSDLKRKTILLEYS
ncbi:PREDICTED: histone acetyltransferase KAT2A-like [Diuraphis noxia]|uniref:histone acetyltransferase KAT2A-like n=1 Tax=Diuraphis noxia TaxID=143948 RepID=UPI000763B676|nr:PREDICTED: histone acetyltransferase KAT2A-like [Diuraphis noxia]